MLVGLRPLEISRSLKTYIEVSLEMFVNPLNLGSWVESGQLTGDEISENFMIYSRFLGSFCVSKIGLKFIKQEAILIKKLFTRILRQCLENLWKCVEILNF